MLHQGVTETHDRRTLVLRLHLQRIQRFADIADGDVLVNEDFAGFGVYFDFEGGAVELIKGRRST